MTHNELGVGYAAMVVVVVDVEKEREDKSAPHALGEG